MPQLDTKTILAAIGYAALTGIINLIFSRKSQIEAYALANPRLAALGKFLRAVGFDPQNFWAFLVLLTKKDLPAAQKSDSAIAKVEQRKADEKRLKDPEPTGTGFGPPSALLILLAAGFALLPALALQGCAAAKRLPCDEQRLTAIDAAYLAKVGKACLQYASAAECPELPELRAEHSRQLREACPQ